MDNREEAILKTLLYADIFDFPLTKEEIYKYLISEKTIHKTDIAKILKTKKLPIENAEDYFYLSGRKDLVEKRKRRKVASVKKLNTARAIIRKCSLLPTVEFIGISGALSMENSDEDDDIDIFVITKRGFVWTTRLLLVILLIMLGAYRNRKTKNYSDKICLNMILDKANIHMSEEDGDLYTAHEIAQLLPVFDRENTYERFIKNNAWVNKFIPNFSIKKNYTKGKNNFWGVVLVVIMRILFLEKISGFLQLKYMEKHRTRETVKDGLLKFDPFDYKTHVLRIYGQKMKKLNLQNIL